MRYYCRTLYKGYIHTIIMLNGVSPKHISISSSIIVSDVMGI